MAIRVTRQNERSDRGSMDAPYHVIDESLAPGTELDQTAAIAAAAARGAIDQGTEADDYDYERQSHKSAIVRLRYSDNPLNPLPGSDPTPLDPPPVGSASFSFNAIHFEPTHKTYSLGTKWRRAVPPIGGRPAPAAPPDFLGRVNVQTWSNESGKAVYGGYTLQLPPETHNAEYFIPKGEFTRAYEKTVSDLLWKVHGGPTTFFGRPAGSVMLVRAQAQYRSNDDLRLAFGFSYIPNGHRRIGDISTASLPDPQPPDGHDYLWDVTATDFIHPGEGVWLEVPYPMWVYCEQIWERGDLNELQLPGSTEIFPDA